jgi:hypothetical protein
MYQVIRINISDTCARIVPVRGPARVTRPYHSHRVTEVKVAIIMRRLCLALL